MATWLLTIFLILLASYLLEIVTSALNIRALSAPLPEEFSTVYTPTEYRKSQDYTQALTLVSLFESGTSTFLTIAFILLSGFNYLDIWTRNHADTEVIIGLLFIGTLLCLSFLASLPFSIYKTFVVEERFGVNRTSIKTFLFDLLKGAMLAVLIAVPLLALILWLFNNVGPHGWWLCWIGIIIFSLAIQFFAPILIMPLFNKFSPLEDGPLRKAITDYARRESFTLRGIYTMDGSKRSSKANAFFTGFGKFKKIVFFDTLLEKFQPEEILAVLAHEMGHYKLLHIPKNIIASIIQQGIILFCISLTLNSHGLSQAIGIHTPSVHAGLIVFALLFIPINLLLSILLHFISRRHEFAADEYALNSTGTCRFLVNALIKLCGTNLTNLTPHPFEVFLHYTHPPVLERIRKLQKLNSESYKNNC